MSMDGESLHDAVGVNFKKGPITWTPGMGTLTLDFMVNGVQMLCVIGLDMTTHP